MKILINFADEKFKFNQKVNSLTGKYIGGFDKVIEYSPNDIDNDFFQNNKSTLETKRGVGLWLWKPYFILKTLETLNEGDQLFYCDSGSIFLRNISHLVKEMEREKLNIFISFTPHISKNWTRKYVFDFFNVNTEEYYNALQPCAGYMLIKKNQYSVDFIKEWLLLCQNSELIRDVINGEENFLEFKDHRHDQSLLSILVKKYKFEYYKDISQYGNEPFYFETFSYTNLPVTRWSFKGHYPVILLLYRNGGLFKSTVKYFIKIFLFNLSKNFYYKLLEKKQVKKQK